MIAIVAAACLQSPAQADALAPTGPIREIYAQALEADRVVVRGRDGWLYFLPELHFLSVGRFWGEDAARVSRSTKPEHADPLPAITDFHEQLHGAGIELVVIPVPAKATIHPAYLPGSFEAHGDRNDRASEAFLGELARHGVRVLDLVPAFLAAAREEPSLPLYCKTDTHWSPRGIDIATREITAFLVAEELVQAGSLKDVECTREAITIDGDLRQLADDKAIEREQLVIGKPAAVLPAFERTSPLVLLGDSYVLVFSVGGDMHAEGAGLGEHLAHALGRSIDRVGVRGSGATAPRINLLQRRDDLQGKELVLWVFGASDLTEADGWRKVPVIRQPAVGR